MYKPIGEKWEYALDLTESEDIHNGQEAFAMQEGIKILFKYFELEKPFYDLADKGKCRINRDMLRDLRDKLNSVYLGEET